MNRPTETEPRRPLPSRRDFLRIGCVGTLAVTAGAVGVANYTGALDRLKGVTHTPLLEPSSAWRYAGGELRLALADIPELEQAGSAVRIEDTQLPEDLLIVYGVDGEYYAYINKCTHGQRKIDLDENGQLRCTSIGQSQFDYDGRVLSGSAVDALTTYTVERRGGDLIITFA